MKRMLTMLMALALLVSCAGCAAVATTANLRTAEAMGVITDITVPPAATPEGTPGDATPPLETAAPELTTPPQTPEAPQTPEWASPPPTIELTPTPTLEPAATPTTEPAPEYDVDEIDDKKAYLNAGTANLREGPGTDYPILEELFELEPLVVTGKSGDWYRVEVDHEAGFVLAEFVEFGSAPTPKPSFEVEEMDDEDAYVNAGSANLREGPGTKYDIVAELRRYEEITVTGESGDWYRVEYGRKEGFMSGEFVEFGAPPTPTPKATSTEPPRETEPPAETAEPRETPEQTAEPTKTPEQTAAPTKAPERTKNASSSGVDPYDYFNDTGSFSAEELLLIAQVVQEEAKGGSVEARAAVANTIYNRYISSRYPDTIEGVIFQKNQYTVADDEDEIRSVKPIDESIEAVKQIFVDGNTFLPEDVVFFRTESRGKSWGDKREYYATYGGNAFFRSLY